MHVVLGDVPKLNLGHCIILFFQAAFGTQQQGYVDFIVTLIFIFRFKEDVPENCPQTAKWTNCFDN
jgi:hypothetical protein